MNQEIDNKTVILNPIDLNSENEREQIKNKKSNKLFIISGIIIGLLTISLIGGFCIRNYYVKPIMKEEPMIKSEKVENKIHFKSRSFKEDEGIKPPFTLILRAKQSMKPEWSTYPFEDGTYTKSSSSLFGEGNMTCKTDYERSKKGGLDINLSEETNQKLIGSSFTLDKLISAFREYQKEPKFINANWLKFQVDKYTVDSITLSDTYVNSIKAIFQRSDLNDTEKAERLIQIFDDSGYFVPQTFGMGGEFGFTFESESQEETDKITSEIKEDINGIKPGVNTSYSKNISHYDTKLNYIVIGGSKNINVTNSTTYGQIAQWYNQLNEENYSPVYYEKLTPISDYFPSEIKDFYKLHFEKEISKRFQTIYDKYLLLEQAAGMTVDLTKHKTTAGKSYPYGLDPEIDVNNIKRLDPIEITESREYSNVWSIHENQKIVGYKITQNESLDLMSGPFQVHSNPLLTSEISITFWNGDLWWTQDWTLEIYYVELD